MRANPKLNLGSEFPTLLEQARLMLQTLPDKAAAPDQVR
jgi:hypothetical protein